MKQNTKTKKITVIGAAIVDVLAGPLDLETLQAGSQPVSHMALSFGGDALNEAVALSRMGREVELISKVGQDEGGSQVLRYLQENNVSCDKIYRQKGLTTGMNIVLLDKAGERYFLTNPESSLRKLGEEDIVPHLEDAAEIVSFASLFVSPQLPIPAMERLAKRIKSRPNRRLAMDMTKAKNGERLADLKNLLPLVDYLFCNREEAALLAGTTDPDIILSLFLEHGAPCVILKCGKDGCHVATPQKRFSVPAYPVSSVVDTTGAGDTFAAGFLWALSEGLPLADCARFGSAAASCSVEHLGAVTGISSLEKIKERFVYLQSLEGEQP
jgi:sugar/nucleoside kinase (ribokinase family)